MTGTPSTKLAGLQSMRALAAIMALIGHTIAEAEHYFGVPLAGDAIPWTRGVDLFFVISGFVVTLSASRFHAQPLTFFKRRLVRVVPLYYLFTTLMVAVLLLLPGAAKDTNLDLGQILSSYGFLPYARSDGRIAPVLSLGWTLNYEIFFYALFAISLCMRNALATVAGLLILLVLVGLAIPYSTTAISFWTNPLILEFLFGIGLARLYQLGLVYPSALLAIIGLIVGLGLLILLGTLDLPRVIAAGVPSTIVIASATLLCPNVRTPGQLLGDASYAVYLSHRFTLRAATLLLLPLMPQSATGAWIYVGGVIVLALMVGGLTHLLLERPMMQWLNAPGKAVAA